MGIPATMASKGVLTGVLQKTCREVARDPRDKLKHGCWKRKQGPFRRESRKEEHLNTKTEWAEEKKEIGRARQIGRKGEGRREGAARQGC